MTTIQSDFALTTFRPGNRFARLCQRLRRMRQRYRLLCAYARIRRHPRWAIDDDRMLRDIGIDPAPPHWYRWLVELARH